MVLNQSPQNICSCGDASQSPNPNPTMCISKEIKRWKFGPNLILIDYERVNIYLRSFPQENHYISDYVRYFQTITSRRLTCSAQTKIKITSIMISLKNRMNQYNFTRMYLQSHTKMVNEFDFHFHLPGGL